MKRTLLWLAVIIGVSLIIQLSENCQTNMGLNKEQTPIAPVAEERGTRIQVSFPAKEGKRKNEKVLFIKGQMELTRTILVATHSKKMDAAVFVIKTSHKKYVHLFEDVDEVGLWTEGFKLTFTYTADQPPRKQIANMFAIRNFEGKTTARMDCPSFPGDIASVHVHCRPNEDLIEFKFRIERTGPHAHSGNAAGIGQTIEVATPAKLPKWEDD